MEFHETKGGHEFYYGTMPALSKSMRSIADSLVRMNERSETDLKKFAEVVFDLTLIANFEIGLLDKEPDMEPVFEKIYELAKEFYYGDGPYRDTGSYPDEINSFGTEKLREYFQKEDEEHE